jgi:hypothetical protein
MQSSRADGPTHRALLGALAAMPSPPASLGVAPAFANTKPPDTALRRLRVLTALIFFI